MCVCEQKSWVFIKRKDEKLMGVYTGRGRHEGELFRGMPQGGVPLVQVNNQVCARENQLQSSNVCSRKMQLSSQLSFGSCSRMFADLFVILNTRRLIAHYW